MDITSDPDTRRSAIGILTLFDREVQPAAVRILEVGQVKKSYILIFVGGPLIDFGAWWYAVNTISPNLRHLYCTTHNFSPGNGRHRGPAVLSTRGRRLRAPSSRRRLALALRGVGQVPTRAQHGGQSARPTRAPRRRRGARAASRSG